MKKILFTLAIFASAILAHAQGTVAFNNGTLTRITVTPVGSTPGGAQTVNAAVGSVNVGLFYGTSSGSLTLASSLGTIGSTPGIFTAPSGTLFSIPGIAGGQTAFLQVRAWSSSFGSDWQAAQNAFNQGVAGTIFGETSIIQSVLGQPTGPATVIWQTASGTAGDRFTPLQAFQAVPEPSTFALGALGIGALLMVRRRKA